MRVDTVDLDNAFVQHFEIVQSVQYDSQASQRPNFILE